MIFWMIFVVDEFFANFYFKRHLFLFILSIFYDFLIDIITIYMNYMLYFILYSHYEWYRRQNSLV